MSITIRDDDDAKPVDPRVISEFLRSLRGDVSGDPVMDDFASMSKTDDENSEDESDTISPLRRAPVAADAGLVEMRNPAARQIVVAAVEAPASTPSWTPPVKFQNAVLDGFLLWKSRDKDWAITVGDLVEGETPVLTLRVYCNEHSFRETEVTALPSGKWTARQDVTGPYTTLAALLVDFRKFAQTTFLSPCMLKDTLMLPSVHDYIWIGDRFLDVIGTPDVSKISPGQVTRNRNAIRLSAKNMEGLRLESVFASQPHLAIWKLRTPSLPLIFGYHVDSKMYFICDANFTTVYCSYSAEDLLERALTLRA